MSQLRRIVPLACVAALLTGQAAHAGELFILNFGGVSGYVQVDGSSYTMEEDVAFARVSPGYHTVIWSANGSQYSASIYLSSADAIPATGEYAETWCLEITNSNWVLPSADECDEDLFYMLW
jgi:5-keto 4-deoxyuronate isomerase